MWPCFDLWLLKRGAFPVGSKGCVWKCLAGWVWRCGSNRLRSWPETSDSWFQTVFVRDVGAKHGKAATKIEQKMVSRLKNCSSVFCEKLRPICSSLSQGSRLFSVENLHPILKVDPAMLAAASKCPVTVNLVLSVNLGTAWTGINLRFAWRSGTQKSYYLLLIIIILHIIIMFPFICNLGVLDRADRSLAKTAWGPFFSVGQSGALRDTTLEAFAGDCPGLQHVSIDHKRLKLEDNH